MFDSTLRVRPRAKLLIYILLAKRRLAVQKTRVLVSKNFNNFQFLTSRDSVATC